MLLAARGDDGHNKIARMTFAMVVGASNEIPRRLARKNPSTLPSKVPCRSLAKKASARSHVFDHSSGPCFSLLLVAGCSVRFAISVLVHLWVARPWREINHATSPCLLVLLDPGMPASRGSLDVEKADSKGAPLLRIGFVVARCFDNGIGRRRRLGLEDSRPGCLSQ